MDTPKREMPRWLRRWFWGILVYGIVANAVYVPIWLYVESDVIRNRTSAVLGFGPLLALIYLSLFCLISGKAHFQGKQFTRKENAIIFWMLAAMLTLMCILWLAYLLGLLFR